MPDPDSPPPECADKRPHDYPIGSATATPSSPTRMRQLIVNRITKDGPLPFPDFMATALYHPDLGYYAREPCQVGRRGDFFTSVSTGPLFGTVLARRFAAEWDALGKPESWRLLELGAHDATLATDILTALHQTAPEAAATVEYAISEPLPRLREIQRQTLSPFPNIRIVEHPDSLASHPLPGIAFGNEVLDALPFHLVEFRANTWHQLLVTHSDDHLSFESRPITAAQPALTDALAPLGTNFPDGYRTEVRTNTTSFLQPVTRALTRGTMIWLDYGFARTELHHPDRTKGTLRTFSRHRAADNPLDSPGSLDITAHVDFTATAEAARALGTTPTLFETQSAWITRLARPLLLEMEGNPNPDFLRQFQTLTHPAQLGSRFHILEISLDPAATPSDPATLNHRLNLNPESNR
ncbi:MAG: class I SAM-dependent methyltransferase [Verrucomicrobiales bacterium]|nr:SAM-dependent methyltransferase [Verrucomicrobiota bacterium JB025]